MKFVSTLLFVSSLIFATCIGISKADKTQDDMKQKLAERGSNLTKTIQDSERNLTKLKSKFVSMISELNSMSDDDDIQEEIAEYNKLQNYLVGNISLVQKNGVNHVTAKPISLTTIAPGGLNLEKLKTNAIGLENQIAIVLKLFAKTVEKLISKVDRILTATDSDRIKAFGDELQDIEDNLDNELNKNF